MPMILIDHVNPWHHANFGGQVWEGIYRDGTRRQSIAERPLAILIQQSVNAIYLLKTVAIQFLQAPRTVCLTLRVLMRKENLQATQVALKNG